MSPYTIPGIKVKPTPENIFKVVSYCLNVSKEDILNPSQKRKYVQPRYVTMYVFTQKTNLPLTEIASQFSVLYDHTTVMHGRDTILDLMSSDEQIREQVQSILLMFY